MGDVVRPVGFALAGFGVAVAVLSRLVLPDPWLLLTSAVPIVAGLVIATGLIRASRPVLAVGVLVSIIGLALIALGAFALLTSEYGPLAAMFVVPPGVALLAVGVALLVVWRTGRVGEAAPAATAAPVARL